MGKHHRLASPGQFQHDGQTDGQGSAGVVVLTDGSQSAPYPLGIQRNHAATPMQADVSAVAANTAFELTFLDNAGTASLYLTESGGLPAATARTSSTGSAPTIQHHGRDRRRTVGAGPDDGGQRMGR